MNHPKKRAKRHKEDLLEHASSPSIEEVDEFFVKLSDGLVSETLPTESILASILRLKAWQDQMLVECNGYQVELDQALKRLDRQERVRAALELEDRHLDHELDTCRNFELRHLMDLARDEDAKSVQSNAPINDERLSHMDEDESPVGIDAQLLADFLQADVHNPNDKQKIIERLHKELAERGDLVREVKNKQEDLEKLKGDLQVQKSFLASLPKHLETMEKASEPLQRFMTARGLSLVGSERRNRVHLARSLPAPLYTLYYLVQHYLDLPSSTEDTKAVILSVTCGESIQIPVVSLQLPIPGRNNKRVEIHFRYYSDHNAVTAQSSGASNSVNHEMLLQELFPNDKADGLVNTLGSPYQWCNYLGGLYPVTQNQEQMHKSTRVIVIELQRRVRANTTLKYILSCLQRQVIPTRMPLGSSATADKKSSESGKIVKFSLDQQMQFNDTEKLYEKKYFVVLRTTKSDWRLQVNVHLARYPNVTPVWTLALTEEGNPPLHDARVSSILRHVNDSGLTELVDRYAVDESNVLSDATNTDERLPGSSETGCEWILIHQMRYLIESLDADQDNVS